MFDSSLKQLANVLDKVQDSGVWRHTGDAMMEYACNNTEVNKDLVDLVQKYDSLQRHHDTKITFLEEWYGFMLALARATRYSDELMGVLITVQEIMSTKEWSELMVKLEEYMEDK